MGGAAHVDGQKAGKTTVLWVVDSPLEVWKCYQQQVGAGVCMDCVQPLLHETFGQEKKKSTSCCHFSSV